MEGSHGMREKPNYKAVIAGLILIITGIISVLLDIFIIHTQKGIWVSVGCSLLASGLVILLQAVFVDLKRVDQLESWGIERIYKTRSEKNKDSDPKLDSLKYRLDVVAFGLKSFRNLNENKVAGLLERGVRVRILTMDPDGNEFLTQREKEENEPEGQIRNSIKGLVEWASKLNKSRKNKTRIEIKGYKCMTLDFYWRMDDELYVGPYWYGLDSQQTITYKFRAGKDGFSVYENYFERLWQDSNNTVNLAR